MQKNGRLFAQPSHRSTKWLWWDGGESGIRTHGTVSRTHAFQACALSHSAISPERPLLKGRRRFCKGLRKDRREFRQDFVNKQQYPRSAASFENRGAEP